MRSAVRILSLLTVSTLSLAGCREKRSSEISFVIAPDASARLATVECRSSSTGACHFTFSTESSPTEIKLDVGETITVKNVTSNTMYCGEASKPALAKCQFRAVGYRRHTEQKKWSSDKAKI